VLYIYIYIYIWKVKGTLQKAEEHTQYSMGMFEMYTVTKGEWTAENSKYGQREPRTRGNKYETY
jgi:hypothetical protein